MVLLMHIMTYNRLVVFSWYSG